MIAIGRGQSVLQVGQIIETVIAGQAIKDKVRRQPKKVPSGGNPQQHAGQSRTPADGDQSGARQDRHQRQDRLGPEQPADKGPIAQGQLRAQERIRR